MRASTKEGNRVMKNRITKIQVQKKNTNRLSIFIDNRFSFGVYKKTWIKFNLSKGDLLDEKLREEILVADEYMNCINKAYSLLTYKDRTENELRDKLKAKEFRYQTITKVLEKLKEQGYIDDEDYTKRYIATYRHKMGKYKLKYKLKNKGVGEDIIERQLNKYSDTYDYEQAYVLAEKRNAKYKDISYQKRYQRIAGYLQRRGYSYSIIKSILEEVLEKYRPY